MAKKWIEYLLLLAGCVAFYIFWQDYLSAFVLVFFLFLPLLSLLMLPLVAWGVRVGLETGAGDFQRGAPIPIRLRIRSAPFMARLRLRLILRNDTFGLETAETIFLSAGRAGQVSHNVSTAYCGQITCLLKEARVYDFLGLFSLRKRPRGDRMTLFILPSAYWPDLQANGGNAPSPDSDTFSQTVPGNDPTELFGIRAFREGDRLSQIHWKLSAKTGRDLVIEGGLPVASSRFLLVELGGTPDCLEALLATFYTLSGALLAREMPHLAGWYDSAAGETAVREITGENDLREALEAILATGRAGREPAALENCPLLPGRCSHALYLTSRFSDGEAALLHDRFPSGKRTVLLVGEDAPDAAPSQDPELVPVDPARIENSLRGFAL